MSRRRRRRRRAVNEVLYIIDTGSTGPSSIGLLETNSLRANVEREGKPPTGIRHPNRR